MCFKKGDEGGQKPEYWSQYVAVLTASLTMFTSGISLAWPSPSVPKLLSDDYPFPITPEEASYISITAPIAGVIGSIAMLCMIDLLGRKLSILLLAVPQIASMLMIYMSTYTPLLLYCGRFMSGLAEGGSYTVIPIYIAEVSSPAIRGTLLSYLSIALIAGFVVVSAVGSLATVESAALVYLVFPVALLAIFVWMPDSPYYLVQKGRNDEAREALAFLRRCGNVEPELKSINSDLDRQLSEPGRFRDLVSIPSNRKACLVMLGLRFAQQLSGISAFTLYAQTMFKDAAEDFSPQLASVVYTTFQLISVSLSAVLVDKLGRKPLLIFSSAGCSLVLGIQTVYFALKDHTDLDLSFLNWLPIAGMLTYVLVVSVGLSTVVNMMPGELFSASIKAKASCLMNIHYSLCVAVVTKFFQATSYYLGLTVPYATFTIFCVISATFCYYCVPETKGKTLEEIQQWMKGNKTEDGSDKVDVKVKMCKISTIS